MYDGRYKVRLLVSALDISNEWMLCTIILCSNSVCRCFSRIRRTDFVIVLSLCMKYGYNTPRLRPKNISNIGLSVESLYQKGRKLLLQLGKKWQLFFGIVRAQSSSTIWKRVKSVQVHILYYCQNNFHPVIFRTNKN